MDVRSEGSDVSPSCQPLAAPHLLLHILSLGGRDWYYLDGGEHVEKACLVEAVKSQGNRVRDSPNYFHFTAGSQEEVGGVHKVHLSLSPSIITW